MQIMQQTLSIAQKCRDEKQIRKNSLGLLTTEVKDIDITLYSKLKLNIKPSRYPPHPNGHVEKQ